jgi:hypothetical protein
MESNQKEKVGAGILTMSIIHLVFNSLGMLGLLASVTMKDQIKELGTPEITTSALIISSVFITIITLAIILILMKKQIGIYIYFIAQVANIAYAVVANGFDPMQIITVIMPVLMGIFIWQKKEVFGLGAKAGDASL